MKNKYQEALDELLYSANHLNDHIYSCDDVFDEYVDIIIDNANSLQELVDKKKPMKVVKWKLAQPETRCAKCGAGLERKHDYCWGCGTKVDWSEDND